MSYIYISSWKILYIHINISLTIFLHASIFQTISQKKLLILIFKIFANLSMLYEKINQLSDHIIYEKIASLKNTNPSSHLTDIT